MHNVVVHAEVRSSQGRATCPVTRTAPDTAVCDVVLTGSRPSSTQSTVSDQRIPADFAIPGCGEGPMPDQTIMVTSTGEVAGTDETH